jgi:hypothetical protein
MSDSGQILGSYRIRPWFAWVAQVIVLLLALSFSVTAWQQSFSADSLVLAAMAWVSALVLLWYNLQTPLVVEVYDSGVLLKFIHRKRLVAWPKLHSIGTKGYRAGLFLELLIVDTDGQAGLVKIPRAKQKGDALSFAQLQQELAKYSLPYRLANAKQQFAKGQRLRFGATELNTQGIYRQGQFLSWRDAQFSANNAQQEIIVITAASQSQPWHMLLTSELNDPDVLLALMSELSKE